MTVVAEFHWVNSNATVFENRSQPFFLFDEDISCCVEIEVIENQKETKTTLVIYNGAIHIPYFLFGWIFLELSLIRILGIVIWIIDFLDDKGQEFFCYHIGVHCDTDQFW